MAGVAEEDDSVRHARGASMGPGRGRELERAGGRPGCVTRQARARCRSCHTHIEEEDRVMSRVTAGRWPREIVFHAYPRLIFAWPIILLGFLLYPLDARGLVSPDILAWLWGTTLFVVILTLGVHVNRNLSLFWAVL